MILHQHPFHSPGPPHQACYFVGVAFAWPYPYLEIKHIIQWTIILVTMKHSMVNIISFINITSCCFRPTFSNHATFLNRTSNMIYYMPNESHGFHLLFFYSSVQQRPYISSAPNLNFISILEKDTAPRTQVVKVWFPFPQVSPAVDNDTNLVCG